MAYSTKGKCNFSMIYFKTQNDAIAALKIYGTGEAQGVGVGETEVVLRVTCSERYIPSVACPAERQLGFA